MTLSVGLDVGATNILGALVDAEGAIVASTTARTPRADHDALFAVLSSVVAEVSGDAGPERVGLAVAGRVGEADGLPSITSARVDWGGGAVVRRLVHRLGAPVTVANDAAAAAWGELQAGSARALTHYMLLTVGTGLGGGIVVDGRPYRGATGASGEVGHLTLVNPDGRPCPCGKTGCWEQYASGTALVLEAKSAAADNPSEAAPLVARVGGDTAALTGAHVAEAAGAGDPLAIGVFERVASALARGILEVNEMLDLEAVVMGGGVIDATDLLLPAVDRHIAHLSETTNRAAPRLVCASLGRHAGVVGAALMALQNQTATTRSATLFQLSTT
jgi:glucokinase